MIGWLFDTFLINPLANIYVLLSWALGNAGLAVIALTLVIRLVTLPLTIRQLHSTRAMAALQPRMAEIQKKYKDPKRRSEEQMKLYKELGVNPLGCLGPMLIQMPILIALYRTFRLALGSSPEALIDLSHRLYPWSVLRQAVPLHEKFLWLTLGSPDPFLLPLLVAATTYIVQKMTTMPTTDEKQAAQNSMMTLMMPLIFGWITISLPSGLGLYYVLSNLIQIVMQYFYTGRGPFNWRALVGLSREPVLPNAVLRREADQQRALKPGGTDGASAEAEEEERPADRTAGAARRRRRYASGRRRGRR